MHHNAGLHANRTSFRLTCKIQSVLQATKSNYQVHSDFHLKGKTKRSFQLSTNSTKSRPNRKNLASNLGRSALTSCEICFPTLNASRTEVWSIVQNTRFALMLSTLTASRKEVWSITKSCACCDHVGHIVKFTKGGLTNHKIIQRGGVKWSGVGCGDVWWNEVKWDGAD